jgi:hypothetical protein
MANNEESKIQCAAVDQIEHLFRIHWSEWVMNLKDSKGREYKSSPLFAVPNGSNRNIITAVNLKREGTKSGVWDLLLDIPRGEWHGLRIESKRPKGRLSHNQKQWGNHYDKAGYKKVVCYSSVEIVNAVTEYMEP